MVEEKARQVDWRPDFEEDPSDFAKVYRNHPYFWTEERRVQSWSIQRVQEQVQ